jgi:hypothetical protein
MVAAQALALLGWDVALLGACAALQAGAAAAAAAAALPARPAGGPPGGGAAAFASAVLRARAPAGVFVELLVAAALLVGALAAPLLQAVFGPPERAAPPGADPGAWAAGHGVPKDGRPAPAPAAGAGADACGGSCGRALRPRRRAAAAAVAVLGVGAVAAAVLPAAWAVRFALATPRRMGLLGYLVLALGAALPAMDWLSRARRVPTIIVRKARPPAGFL